MNKWDKAIKRIIVVSHIKNNYKIGNLVLIVTLPDKDKQSKLSNAMDRPLKNTHVFAMAQSKSLAAPLTKSLISID